MDMLRRGLAPVNSAAWNLIDEQVERNLKSKLSVRRFADVSGPFGWDYAARGLGHLNTAKENGGVGFSTHKVQPLVEMRVPFVLDMWSLDDIIRGARDTDWAAAEQAADKAADFEEKAVYEGLDEACILGLEKECSNKPVTLTSGNGAAIQAMVASTVRMMTAQNAIEGPYVLVAGKPLQDEMDKMLGTHSLRHLLLKGCGVSEIIYSPCYEGAFLISTRGGDFELVLGQDFSVGYHGVEGDKIKLYIAESFTFIVHEPRAYVPLVLK